MNFVSKEEALQNFKETFQERPELYSNLGSNVLPASLQIQLSEAQEADAVAQKLEGEGIRGPGSQLPAADYRAVERGYGLHDLGS